VQYNDYSHIFFIIHLQDGLTLANIFGIIIKDDMKPNTKTLKKKALIKILKQFIEADIRK
jgi:hypothetical protein